MAEPHEHDAGDDARPADTRWDTISESPVRGVKNRAHRTTPNSRPLRLSFLMLDASSTPRPNDRRHDQPSAATHRRVIAIITTLHRWAESGWSRSAVVTWGFINGA